MRHTIHTLSRRAAALLLAAALALPTVYASAGERKLQTSAQVAEGLTYRNTVTVNGDSRVESFSLELAPDSPVQPFFLQSAGTVYGAATIRKAVSSAQEAGWHVLGAINTDFFSMSTGVPLGIVIENGVYRASSDRGSAILITDGAFSLCESPRVSLTLTNSRTGEVTAVPNLNKYRAATGGLYLFNRDFSTVSTHTDSPGWYVRLKPASGAPDDPLGIWSGGSGDGTLPALTVNSTLSLEVAEAFASSESLVIGENEYILTAADASGYAGVFQSFRPGDRVTLTTSCQDPALSAAQWASGAGDVMLRDGRLTDSSGWTYAKDGRNPRSALGVREDGTVLLYAVDGRQTGYSAGLSQADLADELRAQGCVWAVNLDGGGSTAMSVWVPGQAAPAIQNSPSGGSPRACATFLLLAAPEAGDGEPARLAWKTDGLAVLAGSSAALPETAVLDSGLNLLDRDLPSDLKVESETGLGTIRDGLYTAGTRAGTDTIRLSSKKLGIEGTAQIHVVDTLTELTVRREGDGSALTALTMKPGETVRMTAAGSYWGREALRGLPAVTWTVEGGVGTVDETGLFTASASSGGVSGAIRASAGGLTRTIPVNLVNVHTDVTADHWAYEAVEFCYTNGIVSGVSATEFGRDLPIRRADFVLMLYGALGRPAYTAPCEFTDVSASDYYFAALSWAREAGLASGTGDGAYSPQAHITREQAFTILRQAMPLMGKVCPDASLSVLDQFADKDSIADYAKGHTATLVAQGVVSGRGDGVAPQGQLTRAEMAALLCKLMTYTPIQDVPVDPAEPEQPVDPEQPVVPEGAVLTLNKTELTLSSGESAALAAALEPAVEGAQVQWTSGDPSAVTVTANGTVTNLSPRTEAVDVTVTASWNGLSAACTVHCSGAGRVGTVTGAELGLRVRSGPGTGNSVMGMLSEGDRVVVLGEQGGWYQILYRTALDQAALGYVSGDYLAVSPLP